MDDHHVQLSESYASCGILELRGLTADPRKVLYAIATRLYHPSRGNPAAMLLWSDINREGSNGAELAKFICQTLPFQDYLFVFQGIENPKTSNMIAVWQYIIPHEKFKEWYIRERVERARKI